ncbi:VirB4-like conjugal transfer ATPase, CD1110 family [Patescibacteria group bacterium]
MDPYRSQNPQDQNSGTQIQPENKEESEEKPVFQDQEKKATPQWLEQASQNTGTQIAATGEGEAPNLSEILKAEKPTEAQLGNDPSSLIEVKPNLEVVSKVDQQVRERMLAAGLDPDTGKPLSKVQEVQPAGEAPPPEGAPTAEAPQATAPPAVTPQVVEKKTSILGNVKTMIAKRAEKEGTIQKVDQADAAKKAGQKVNISQEERKMYIEAEKIYQEGLARIKDLIAPSSMEIQYDSIKLDGMICKTFYVYAYPRYIDANWLAPIINFDVTMDISQFIYPISSDQIMKTLKRKVAQMQSSIRINSDKGRVRDPALETSLGDAESLRTEIQRGQEKFFQFALYFTIYADEEKKLEKVAKQLESLLAGKLVMTKRAQLQAEHGFNSTIPIALDEIYTIRNMNTSPLSTTFPFTSSDLTSDKGVLYGLNRHNDSLIIFDRFALENANSVVFAKSGAGKSYAVKLEILRLMMMGTDVIVIDPENEYEELSTTIGGSYLRLSLNSDRRINPFDLGKPMEGESVQPGDILRSNVINLQGLLKIMLGEISPEEESLLDKALIDVYALKGITMELLDPSIYEPPTMEDLHQILGSMEGGKSLVQRLSKYTTGSYSGIFNKPTNVDLSSGLMVFSIRDLEDALRPIAMYIILNYIWAKVRSNLKKRVLVVDEAWSMMQHDDSAKFLFGLVKRARKYYLGVTTITQDVDDFIKNQYGKPIVTNSSMQLLLKQAPSSVNVLAKVFNLTEGEKYVLLNSGVGQGLFFAGQKHVAVQIIASYTEDKIVTTNPEELLKAREGGT